jgi:DNA processing protein
MPVATFAGQHTSEELLGPLSMVESLHAPRHLYLAGDGSLLWSAPQVAVIGSRNPSEFGRWHATRLASFLTEEGITVVGGLSSGIETMAHEAAVGGLGRTIAVLATPLGMPASSRNAGLYRQILDRHLAVSPFPGGHAVTRDDLRRRNQTLSLLADAMVLVEAADGSASLDLAWEMLRLRRPVFLPRPVADADRLDWPGEMLARGAKVLDRPAALLAAAVRGATRRQPTTALRLAS